MEATLYPLAGFRAYAGGGQWAEQYAQANADSVHPFGRDTGSVYDDVEASIDPDVFIERAGLIFDTTAIPQGAVVSSVVLKLIEAASDSITDGDVGVRKCTFNSGNDYQHVANYSAVLAGSLLSTLSNPSGNLWQSGNLVAGFERSAAFSLGLKHEGYDAENPPSSSNYIEWFAINHATYKPSLIVTYELPAAIAGARLAMMGAGR